MLHLASCWVCRRKWQCVGGLPAPTPPLVFVLLQLQSLGVLQLHCGLCPTHVVRSTAASAPVVDSRRHQ